MSSQQHPTPPSVLPRVSTPPPRPRPPPTTPHHTQAVLAPGLPGGGASFDAESTDEAEADELSDEDDEKAHLPDPRRARQNTAGDDNTDLDQHPHQTQNTMSGDEEGYESGDPLDYEDEDEDDDHQGFELAAGDEDEAMDAQDDQDVVHLAQSIVAGARSQQGIWEETRRYGGGSGAGGGGSGGSAGGSGAGAGAGGTPSAFAKVEGNGAVKRRAAMGNGGKKGKGWRAADLPIEIISRILTIFAEQLVGESFALIPTHDELQHRTTTGYGKRCTLAYLRSRNDLLTLRLVTRSWTDAVETLPFWTTLVEIIFGPQKPNNVFPLRMVSHWLQAHCIVCHIAGVSHPRKVVYGAVPSQVGRIAVCHHHSDGFCSRCLYGAFSSSRRAAFDDYKNLMPTMGDDEWFGDEDHLSCRDCREDALRHILHRRGASMFDVGDERETAPGPITEYVVLGEGDAGSAAAEYLELRWLINHTKFAEIQNQALFSRAISRPEKRTPEEIARLRRMYRNPDDDDEMEGSYSDDDFEDYEDSEEEDLSKSDLMQVAEMALKDWMNQRVVEGFWISPTEQNEHLSTKSRRGPTTASNGKPLYAPAFKVAQPLLTYAASAAEEQPHHPMTRLLQKLPPPGGALTQGMDFVYATALREIIAPAMQQIVRLASFSRDPIRIASSWTTDEIVDFLRMPGAWVLGGLDYLAPKITAMDKERSMSLSARSSVSSNGSRPSPPSVALYSSEQEQPSIVPRASALPTVPSHQESKREQSPFIGPQPPADLVEHRDADFSMHSASSHSQSPSLSPTNPSVSTPPSSTSPPAPSLVHPPPSPRKPAVALPPPPPPPARLMTGTKTLPGGLISNKAQFLPPSRPPPPAPPRPIFPVPCIPVADYVLGDPTRRIIETAWDSAWEPLRRCHCVICLRGMGFSSAAVSAGGAVNENGKRKVELEEDDDEEDERRRQGKEAAAKVIYAQMLQGKTGEQRAVLLEAMHIAGYTVEEAGGEVRKLTDEQMEIVRMEDGPGEEVEGRTKGKETSSDDEGSVKRARTETV